LLTTCAGAKGTPITPIVVFVMPFAYPPLLRTPDAFVKNKSLPRRVFQLRAGLRFVSNSASPVMGVPPQATAALKKKKILINQYRYLDIYFFSNEKK